MIVRGTFFPWRLFWKFFVSFVLTINILAAVAILVSSFFIEVRFDSYEPLIFLSVFLLLSVIAAAFFSFRFSLPLQRVILKALRMANRKQYAESADLEEVLDEEPGEYFELEVALDKIRRKMKKRRLQLSREREEFQALISALGDGILTVTPDLKLKFVNSKFAAQFLGREYQMPREGVALSVVFREPAVLELFSRTLETGAAHNKSLKLLSKIDGTQRFFSITVSPLREEQDREIYGALALFHDITDLKAAEQIRIEFVENASHELRTPLTSVKGFVETLKEDFQTGRLEQIPHFLEIISKNVHRLTELVNDMLTLSSLDASGAIVKKEVLYPEELSQDLIERMASLATEKQVMIQLQTEADSLYADQGKVDQVLQNLLGNAIKYVQEGGKIVVRWEETPQETILKVIDNGPGIAEAHLVRLFERFYRVDKSRARDVGGTGLGLAIVKHIVQSHGGSVAVKSELGRGSEFICVFPK